jgi:dihydropyrimidine dehydrogenase (NAD+) subunit PreT
VAPLEAGGGVLRCIRDGREVEFACDQVIRAIGQTSLVESIAAGRGIDLVQGRVQVDRATGQTSNPKYYAGGDCVNGGREVVDAVADGKRAALGILEAFHG